MNYITVYRVRASGRYFETTATHEVAEARANGATVTATITTAE